MLPVRASFLTNPPEAWVELGRITNESQHTCIPGPCVEGGARDETIACYSTFSCTVLTMLGAGLPSLSMFFFIEKILYIMVMVSPFSSSSSPPPLPHFYDFLLSLEVY